MKRPGWLISKYLIMAVLPYFVFAWLLSSVILFVQQGSRYSEVFFSVQIPAALVWQLTVALIPNVIAFTCPMAILVGTIIGLTRMQADSELVAIRAAGVGTRQIALPIVLLGAVMSLFAFFVNLKGVPIAAALVRNVALQTAIKKLESPIEPGVFNSEMPGYTIFVRDGNVETGRWQGIFIYQEDRASGTVRLITSERGRIDTSGQSSELVLDDAVASTLPASGSGGNYVSEAIGEVRLAVRTKRDELIERMTGSDLDPSRLGLQQLAETVDPTNAKEWLEAQILWNRSLLLSITPLIFAILGTVIVLRFNRGSRGFGILSALVTLLGFYVFAFSGEQLVRLGQAPPVVAILLPLGCSLLAIIGLGLTGKTHISNRVADGVRSVTEAVRTVPRRIRFRDVFVDVTTGIRDFDLIRDLARNFLLTLAFISSIFFIFTAFEIWRSAGTVPNGGKLAAQYLLYLIPFVYLQVAPSAALIATIATYVIKSRQNEVVTWTAAGQSVYRLLLPCFLAMLLLGVVNVVLQETLLPRSNELQENIRSLIRNKGIEPSTQGRRWSVNGNRIYSYEVGQDKTVRIRASDNEKHSLSSWDYTPNFSVVTKAYASGASDNEKRRLSPVEPRNLFIYEIEPGGTRLQAVYRAGHGEWLDGKVVLKGGLERLDIASGEITNFPDGSREIVEDRDPFLDNSKKPHYLTASELRERFRNAASDIERRSMEIAWLKKYTTLFLPFVMALFAAPFSLSLSRKGKALTVGYAVGLWLLFTGASTVFEQLGQNGMLMPVLAVWTPAVLFGLLGTYLLTRVRT